MVTHTEFRERPERTHTHSHTHTQQVQATGTRSLPAVSYPAVGVCTGARPHLRNPALVFQAKDAIMETKLSCECLDFLYHRGDGVAVADATHSQKHLRTISVVALVLPAHTRAAVKRLIARVSPTDAPRYRHSPDRTRGATSCPPDSAQQDAARGRSGTAAAPVLQTAAEVEHSWPRPAAPPPSLGQLCATAEIQVTETASCCSCCHGNDPASSFVYS